MIDLLPSDLILSLTQQLLCDSEAADLARCCSAILKALQRYRIKVAVKFVHALQFADPNPHRFGLVESLRLIAPADWECCMDSSTAQRLSRLTTLKRMVLSGNMQSLEGIEFCPFPASLTELIGSRDRSD